MGVGGYIISHSDFEKCIDMVHDAVDKQASAYESGFLIGVLAMMSAITKSYMPLPDALAEELGDFNGR